MRYFHCSVHKAGSHWITAMLADPWLRQWAPSKPEYLYPWNNTNRNEESYVCDLKQVFSSEIPDNIIVSPLYTGWGNFLDFVKDSPYKAIYIIRNPKDIVISMYYSWVKTHYVHEGANVERARRNNATIQKHEVVRKVINSCTGNGLFQAMEDWWKNKNNENVLVLRYEDLIGDAQQKLFQDVFEFFDIQIPRETSEQFLRNFTLERMRVLSGNPDHYRKGKAGSWVDDWNPEIEDLWKGKDFLQTEHFKALPYDDI